jgi:mono/diheme cytochrome c family protein
VLYLEKDEPVLLRLLSADLMHKFYAPRLQLGPVTVKPGHAVELRFTANEVGVFQYYCTATCGSCHFYMRGWIVISEKGAEPVVPPPILCPLCLPDFGPPPEGPELVPLGEYLYVQKGCSTCHGFEARGGVENPNFTNLTVPAHHRTAEKFFLQDPDEAECLIALLQENPGLADLGDHDQISRCRLVEARLDMAREIITGGKYSAKMDPEGPEPPLQMPAWQYIVDDREIDALLAYFVSLMPWDEDEEDEL